MFLCSLSSFFSQHTAVIRTDSESGQFQRKKNTHTDIVDVVTTWSIRANQHSYLIFETQTQQSERRKKSLQMHSQRSMQVNSKRQL